MIEIAPRVLWKEGTITEAVIYCFCLGDGWRLPTVEECFEMLSLNLKGFWNLEDINDNWTTETHTIIPVRSIDN
jgi:hypothetical protein